MKQTLILLMAITASSLALANECRLSLGYDLSKPHPGLVKLDCQESKEVILDNMESQDASQSFRMTSDSLVRNHGMKLISCTPNFESAPKSEGPVYYNSCLFQ